MTSAARAEAGASGISIGAVLRALHLHADRTALLVAQFRRLDLLGQVAVRPAVQALGPVFARDEHRREVEDRDRRRIKADPATNGVQMDGGSGAVQVKSNGSVSVEGMSVSVKGQTTAELKAAASTTISGGLVKIN